MFELQECRNLFGDLEPAPPDLDRGALANKIRAQLQDLTLESLVPLLTTEFRESVEYVGLMQGEPRCSKTSLLFNPHRLSTKHVLTGKSMLDHLQDPKFADGLARAALWTRDLNLRDWLYRLLEMGISGSPRIDEFRPNKVRQIALEFDICKSSKVLDPCAGWGGRLLGFSTVTDSYTAYDPSTRTMAGLKKMATEFIAPFRPAFCANLNCLPFEEAELQEDHFDFAMTSPPYYDTELYGGEEATNSHNRYQDFPDWVAGFYEPFLKHTIRALKPGAPLVCNIGSRRWPLDDELYRICEEQGYTVERMEKYNRGSLADHQTVSTKKPKKEGEAFYAIRKN